MLRLFAVLTIFTVACSGPAKILPEHREARLTARPVNRKQCKPGMREVGSGVRVVPHTTRPQMPVIVYFYGARADLMRTVEGLRAHAEALGAILLVPSAEFRSWDSIRQQTGPDVASTDALLKDTFKACSVDRSFIAAAGFSDGASYALTLGLANGDLFTHVIALAPCFIGTEITPRGRPLVFITHGTRDKVFPIDRCGRPIARRLRDSGLGVTYVEYEGGHLVPPEMQRAGFEWFLKMGTTNVPPPSGESLPSEEPEEMSIP